MRFWPHGLMKRSGLVNIVNEIWWRCVASASAFWRSERTELSPPLAPLADTLLLSVAGVLAACDLEATGAPDVVFGMTARLADPRYISRSLKVFSALQRFSLQFSHCNPTDTHAHRETGYRVERLPKGCSGSDERKCARSAPIWTSVTQLS